MRAGRGERQKEKKNFRAASDSRPKTGEMEVKSESFTPPGVALATFRLEVKEEEEEEEEVGKRSPPALTVM